VQSNKVPLPFTSTMATNPDMTGLPFGFNATQYLLDMPKPWENDQAAILAVTLAIMVCHELSPVFFLS